MCNNVIDNIIEGKEITELFNPPAPSKKGMRNPTYKLPKVNNNNSNILKEEEKKQNNGLFSEKFIKPKISFSFFLFNSFNLVFSLTKTFSCSCNSFI